ncbi:MAG: isoprenylcysteine carboxylmethyltransferase family protein [Acidobacteriota bacterium]|nr:MAG: isoprenylcysteine carboxylmethyltransferase family protein [Acidobacteriota bacterium]
MTRRDPIEIVRLVLLYGAVAALVSLSRPTCWSVAVGAGFVATGEALRIWAAGHLDKNDRLTTSGPYRFTRNPLYLGRLIVYTGLVLMAWFSLKLNAALLVGGWLLFFGYYVPRKERIEPARLTARHGEAYRRYFDAVPALFPRGRAWSEDGHTPWRWDRLQRHRELLTTLGLASVVAVMALRAAGLLP